MTSVSLLAMQGKHPCGVFDEFVLCLGKSRPDESLVSISDFVRHVALPDAVWPLLKMPEFSQESSRFRAWCAKTLIGYVKREISNPTAIQRQIDSLERDDLSDEERKVIAVNAKSETASLKTVVGRSAGRLCCLKDPVKSSQSAAWISARGGCQLASFEAQRLFLLGRTNHQTQKLISPIQAGFPENIDWPVAPE